MTRPSNQFIWGTGIGFVLGSQLLVVMISSGSYSEHQQYWLGFSHALGITPALFIILVGILGWCGILQRLMNAPHVPTRASMRSMTLGLVCGIGLFAVAIVGVGLTIIASLAG